MYAAKATHRPMITHFQSNGRGSALAAALIAG
jgi:hypothetical protein